MPHMNACRAQAVNRKRLPVPYGLLPSTRYMPRVLQPTGADALAQPLNYNPEAIRHRAEPPAEPEAGITARVAAVPV